MEVKSGLRAVAIPLGFTVSKLNVFGVQVNHFYITPLTNQAHVCD